MPTKATEGSAGWDLHAAEDAAIREGTTLPVSVGFRVQLPSDIEMQVRSRSGLSLKGVSVANSPGTVDADFRGIVKVILRYNPSPADPEVFVIKKGDRIAQAIFAWVPKFTVEQVTEVDETSRGDGGFGSTGK